MGFVVAEKQGPHGLLLVITDKELLGKTFEERKLILNLSTAFYQGAEKNQAEVVGTLHFARNVIFTGEDAVALGISLDLIDKERIMRVQGIPHAQVMKGE